MGAPNDRDYVTTRRIAAPAASVWRVLTDAAGYAEWNPEILHVAGRFGLDERIKVRVKVGGGAVRALSMRITAFEPPSRMEWTGGLPLGLFVGRRTFDVVPKGDGAEFRMHLHMTGPLARFIAKSVGNRQPEIDSFADALGRRVEQQEGIRR
jgi:uncharacterized protein YndB with AHSA1/START domain